MSNLSTHAKDATCLMRLCGMRMVTLLSSYSHIGLIKSLPIDEFAAGAHYITTLSQLATETDTLFHKKGPSTDGTGFLDLLVLLPSPHLPSSPRNTLTQVDFWQASEYPGCSWRVIRASPITRVDFWQASECHLQFQLS